MFTLSSSLFTIKVFNSSFGNLIHKWLGFNPHVTKWKEKVSLTTTASPIWKFSFPSKHGYPIHSVAVELLVKPICRWEKMLSMKKIHTEVRSQLPLLSLNLTVCLNFCYCSGGFLVVFIYFFYFYFFLSKESPAFDTDRVKILLHVSENHAQQGHVALLFDYFLKNLSV